MWVQTSQISEILQGEREQEVAVSTTGLDFWMWGLIPSAHGQSGLLSEGASTQFQSLNGVSDQQTGKHTAKQMGRFPVSQTPHEGLDKQMGPSSGLYRLTSPSYQLWRQGNVIFFPHL